MVTKELGAVSTEILKRNVPAELRTLKQWVLVRIEEVKGVPTKVPYQIRNPFFKAKSNKPSMWGDFDSALEAFEASEEGRFVTIGFVLTENDPFTFVDLDDVVNEDGSVVEEVQQVIDRMDSYTERSLSRTGFHVVLKAKKTGTRCRTHAHEWLEVYDHGRLMTVTGDVPTSVPRPVREAQQELDQLCSRYLPNEDRIEAQEALEESQTLSDKEVIDLILAGRNRARFTKLWAGDTSDHSNDDSTADFALCCILGELTRSPEQIDRLFRSSGLLRPKWDSPRDNETYGSMTIKNALKAVRTKQRPVIITNDRQDRDVIDDILSLLKGPLFRRVFVRKGSLCRIVIDSDGRASAIDYDPDSLLRDLVAAADFISSTKMGESPSKLTKRIVSMLLASSNWSGFRVLDAVESAPYLKANGSVVTENGYDEDSKAYLHMEEEVYYPMVSESPSSSERQEAIDLLKEMILNFPFESESSRANALALTLSPALGRANTGRIPLCVIDATTAGSGKSLLAECINLIYDEQAGMFSLPDKDEETRKLITTVLLNSRKMIVFDNENGSLKNKGLSILVTTTYWEDRLLGGNTAARLRNTAQIVITGNNVQQGSELCRRSYFVRLDPKMERPDQRDPGTFHHPRLRVWVTENRGRLLWAVHTLIRAWFDAGKPCANPMCRAFGSFEEWTEMMSGILHHAGVMGFMEDSESHWNRMNAESDDWRTFFSAWFGHFGPEPQSVSTIHALLSGQEEPFSDPLPEEIQKALEGNEKSSISRLGKVFKKMEGRRFLDAGLHLCRAETRTSTTYPWRVLVDMPELLPEKTESQSLETAELTSNSTSKITDAEIEPPHAERFDMVTLLASLNADRYR